MLKIRQIKLISYIKWALCGGCLFLTLCIALALGIFFSPKPHLLDGVEFGKIVLDANNNILRLSLSKDQKYRYKVELDQIAPQALEALLFYEDQYFYSHPGINLFSLIRAALSSISGRKMGASTITMQIARLRYQLKTSTIPGKLHQIWLALALERHYSKSAILEAYFNLAPYGSNIEGIEAAARIYFNKPASQLSSSECVALAVVPQNPSARQPGIGKAFDQTRTRLESTLDNKFSGIKAGAIAVRQINSIPFFASHLATELLRTVDSHQIHTSIERELQAILETSLLNFKNNGQRFGLTNASALLVDCGTMEVKALAGSADFFNKSISGQIDGTNIRRSPGSTLKPFIYALALEKGLIHPGTILPDSPKSFGGYDPENFDKGFRGPISARDALLASRNLPAIKLAEQLKNPDLFEFLQQANINFEKDRDYYGLAIALGGAELTMRDLAALYAMLANRGVWQPLRFCKEQKKISGKKLLSSEVAWLTLWMLERDQNIGSIPLRCKTGTSNGLRDAWTCGIIGNYVLAVWVGNFDNSSNPYLVGAKSALPLFEEIAFKISRIRPLKDNQQHPDLAIKEVDICQSTGDLQVDHCKSIGKTWIIPGISPIRNSNILRPILVDKETGLRACEYDSEKTEELWLEFWPTEMLNIFETAGINKPGPPNWMPACDAKPAMKSLGSDPKIVLPKKNITYIQKLSAGNWKIPFQASCDPDVKQVFWYANSQFVGQSKPGETFFWQNPVAGNVEILAVDDNGRGCKQLCKIDVIP